MLTQGEAPTVVLICHQQDRLDRAGLASWLASTMKLAGLLIIRDQPAHRWRAARRELRRVGILKFLDVAAFRVYSRLMLAASDSAWQDAQLARLRSAYPADLDAVPQLVVSNPNSAEARAFLERLRPDIVIARCKVILEPAVFHVPRAGTFVLHPGICPEYRNAHGCFWALANRDLERVGMTLLRVDEGIDTGPVYLHATCEFDELRDSHVVIQYRAVVDNLDAIGRTLAALARGEHVPRVNTAGRRSAVWGQPRLTDYLRWKRAARRAHRPQAVREVLS
jgi:folate-dependent phosphoribosylglycinamide formyltransferase PurN